MDDAVILAELLCARLAHDLSGPLGTMAAAVELLGDQDAETRKEALGLAGEATTEMARRLKYLRAAWGTGTEAHSVASIARLAGGVLGGGRAGLDISRVAGPDRPLDGFGRVLMNALLVAGEALPRGGTILCAGDAEGQIALQPIGEAAAWPSGLAGLIAGGDLLAAAAEGGPRGIAAPMMMALARREGATVTLLMGAGVPLLSLARGAAPG
jgi:histidine phosphotransferase ChpT